MYKYDGISIEVTRKCNKSCGYCMRGDTQNITIKDEYIDRFFDDIEDVKEINLTGGEPFLEIDKIEYIINTVIKRKYNVKNLNIVTNGTILSEKILDIFEKLYMHTKASIQIGISYNEEFYDKEQQILALQFYKEMIKSKGLHTYVFFKKNDADVIVYEGRAKEYINSNRKMFSPYGYRKVIQTQGGYNHRIKIKGGTVNCMIELCADGYVGTFGDCSYDKERNNAFGNIIDCSLTRLIDKHNDSCIRLCSECFMYTGVYNNLNFLPTHLQNHNIIFYDFMRLHTAEVWHKRELVKKICHYSPLKPL